MGCVIGSPCDQGGDEANQAVMGLHLLRSWSSLGATWQAGGLWDLSSTRRLLLLAPSFLCER